MHPTQVAVRRQCRIGQRSDSQFGTRARCGGRTRRRAVDKEFFIRRIERVSDAAKSGRWALIANLVIVAGLLFATWSGSPLSNLGGDLDRYAHPQASSPSVSGGQPNKSTTSAIEVSQPAANYRKKVMEEYVGTLFFTSSI